jgi:NAD(P)-dependent dehydrogenase (short-subunit alcohol dehydrogenase family)
VRSYIQSSFPLLGLNTRQSKAGCDALTNAIKAKEDRLHILVNNSGATWGAPFDNVPEKEGWDRILNLNVKSLFYSKL